MPISSQQISQVIAQQNAHLGQTRNYNASQSPYYGGVSYGPTGLPTSGGASQAARAMSTAGHVVAPTIVGGAAMALGMDPVTKGIGAFTAAYKGAGAAGAGFGTAATAGLSAAAVPLAGYYAADKIVEYGVKQMSIGAMQTAATRDYLGAQFGFNNMQGRGMTHAEADRVGGDIRQMSSELGRSFQEITSTMATLNQQGAFTGVQNAKEFRRKLRDQMQALDTISREFGIALQDATQFTQRAKQGGMYSTADQLSTLSGVRQASWATGMGAASVQRHMAQGAQLSRAVGGVGWQGAVGAQNALISTGAMLRGGTLTEGQIAEATGGLTGIQGQAAFSRMAQTALARRSSSKFGRYFLAAAADDDMRGLSQSKLDAMMSGAYSMDEIKEMGREKVYGKGRKGMKDRFLMNEEDMRAQVLEMGPKALAGMMRAEFGDELYSSDRLGLSKKVRRKYGVNKRQASALLEMSRNMPDIIAEEARLATERAEQQQSGYNRKMSSWQAIRGKVKRVVHKVINEPLRELGSDIYKGASELLDKLGEGIASGLGIDTGGGPRKQRLPTLSAGQQLMLTEDLMTGRSFNAPDLMDYASFSTNTMFMPERMRGLYTGLGTTQRRTRTVAGEDLVKTVSNKEWLNTMTPGLGSGVEHLSKTMGGMTAYENARKYNRGGASDLYEMAGFRSVDEANRRLRNVGDLGREHRNFLESYTGQFYGKLSNWMQAGEASAFMANVQRGWAARNYSGENERLEELYAGAETPREEAARYRMMQQKVGRSGLAGEARGIGIDLTSARGIEEFRLRGMRKLSEATGVAERLRAKGAREAKQAVGTFDLSNPHFVASVDQPRPTAAYYKKERTKDAKVYDKLLQSKEVGPLLQRIGLAKDPEERARLIKGLNRKTAQGNIGDLSPEEIKALSRIQEKLEFGSEEEKSALFGGLRAGAVAAGASRQIVAAQKYQQAMLNMSVDNFGVAQLGEALKSAGMSGEDVNDILSPGNDLTKRQAALEKMARTYMGADADKRSKIMGLLGGMKGRGAAGLRAVLAEAGKGSNILDKLGEGKEEVQLKAMRMLGLNLSKKDLAEVKAGNIEKFTKGLSGGAQKEVEGMLIDLADRTLTKEEFMSRMSKGAALAERGAYAKGSAMDNYLGELTKRTRGYGTSQGMHRTLVEQTRYLKWIAENTKDLSGKEKGKGYTVNKDKDKKD